MKPNELRLGNYVRLKDNGEIVAVQRITHKKVGFFHGNGKSRGYFRKYSEIELVPFLDMFPNASKSDNAFVVMVHSNTDPLKTGELFHKGEIDGIFYTKDGLYFKYVHEIQNYHFARYGEELNFDL